MLTVLVVCRLALVCGGGQKVLGRQKKTGWEVGEIGKIILHCIILFQLKKCREVGVSKKGARTEIEG